MGDRMKKLLAITVIILCLSSCQNILENYYTSLKTKELVKVTIPLPQSKESRGFNINEVITYTDYFEVVFKNNSTSSFYTANATIEQGSIEITIPEGNYDVLLIAGDKDYYLNYSPILLASGYVQGKNITLIGPNIIDVVLTLVDFDISVPQKAMIVDDFSVNFVIDFHNPLITDISDSYLRYFGDGTIVADTDGDGIADVSTGDKRLIPENIIKNGTSYNYSVLFKAPEIPGTFNVNYYGYIHVPGGDVWSSGNWVHPAFGNYFFKTIEFVAGADVNMNISWPNL